jgi:hypothetical protein
MAKTQSVIAAVLLSAVAVFLAVTAIVTRNSIAMQKAISELGSNVNRIALTLEERKHDGIQSDLLLLKEKLSELHGAQQT